MKHPLSDNACFECWKQNLGTAFPSSSSASMSSSKSKAPGGGTGEFFRAGEEPASTIRVHRFPEPVVPLHWFLAKVTMPQGGVVVSSSEEELERSITGAGGVLLGRFADAGGVRIG